MSSIVIETFCGDHKPRSGIRGGALLRQHNNASKIQFYLISKKVSTESSGLLRPLANFTVVKSLNKLLFFQDAEKIRAYILYI